MEKTLVSCRVLRIAAAAVFTLSSMAVFTLSSARASSTSAGGSPAAQEPADWGDALVFRTFSIAAVDAFRAGRGLRTGETGSPPGLVDADTVELLWHELEARGIADQIRGRLLETVAVRR